MKSKKGSLILDLILIMVVLLAVSTTILGSMVINKESLDIFESVGMNKTKQIQTSLETGEKVTPTLDYIFLAMAIGLFIALILLAIFVPIHPAFLVLLLFAIAICITLSAYVSNAYEEVRTNEQLISVSSNVPIQNYIMSQLPLILLILGSVVIIILLAKPSSSGGGGSPV